MGTCCSSMFAALNISARFLIPLLFTDLLPLFVNYLNPQVVPPSAQHHAAHHHRSGLSPVDGAAALPWPSLRPHDTPQRKGDTPCQIPCCCGAWMSCVASRCLCDPYPSRWT